MPKIRLKYHKLLIKGLKNIIEQNKGIFQSHLGINGFFLKIKGKISVTGNAKKRSTTVRFGSIDISTKCKKFEYEEGEIHTKVGVLGYKMFLSY
jgi:ribosomal protein S3